MRNNNTLISLPDPSLEGEISVEEAISKRRSFRNYENASLTKEEVSQILWASQRITEPESGFRATPSAGALYPLSVYVVVERVEGIEPGVYRYLVEKHKLDSVKEKSVRDEVYENALRQSSIKEASIIIIIAADYNITETKYGERAKRYVHMEAGHVGQNIYLQTTALGLGTVAIGAFDDKMIKEVTGLREEEYPLYIFPVGRR